MNKIEKLLPFKEKVKILVFAGKHSGEKGIISKINLERNMVELEVEDKKINVLINKSA